MILAFCVALAAASPAAQQRMVAVLPLEPGVLDARASSALEDDVRAAAVRVLGETQVLASATQRERLGGSRLGPVEAARKLSATHVLSASARKVEGALAVSWSLVLADGKTIATTRLAGFTGGEIREDAGRKIEDLLREAFGLAPPAGPHPAPGILRIPVTPRAASGEAAPSPHAIAPSESAAPSKAAIDPGPAVAPAPVVAAAASSSAAMASASVASASQPAVPPAPLAAELAARAAASAQPAAPSGPLAVTAAEAAAQLAVAPAAPAAAPTSPAEPSVSDPLQALIREVTAEVEEVRGLKRQTTLQVLVLDDAAFAKAVRAKAEQELTPKAVARERARWTAFGLAPVSADPAQIVRSVLDEQVAGFYDPKTKALTVREHIPASAAALGPDGLRLVLAHEIEHALQDQHFGIPDLSSDTDDDGRLARLSLFEGDAQATMIAVAAHRLGRPVKAALSGTTVAMKDMTTDDLLRNSGLSPELLHAPAVVREELLAPYVAGLNLVVDVYRRGGWALVNRMFQNPPETMHEVLHPEAYLAGEHPAPVPFPEPPPGLQAVAKGRMGELGARLALGCVEDRVARDFVSAWSGDAYTIVRTASGSLALIWSTSWSDGAQTFANLLKMQTPCWQEAGKEPGQEISAASEVRIDGPRVGLARGLSRFALETAATSAAAFAGLAPAPTPPLGAMNRSAEVEGSHLKDGRFIDPRVAIAGELPPGFDADLSQPEQEIVLRKDQPAAVASVSFVPEAASAETVDGFFQTTALAMATALGGTTLEPKGTQKTLLLGGTAEERSWEVPGTRMEVRVTLAPACDGKAFYAVTRAASEEAPRRALEKFVSSLRVLGVDPSPACEDLE